MAAIALRAASWYLPPTAVAVADLPELAALPAAERAVCEALGIDEIRADDGLSTVDLALRAARQTLAEAGLEPGDVDALVVVEPRAPEAFITSEVTRLQALLGADRALAFSVGGVGCASLTPALLTARGLLYGDPDVRHVLVVHGSRPAAPHRYRHPVTVYGDCGQALLVTRDGGPVRITDILMESDGAYWDLFRVDFRDRPEQAWREVCTDVPRYSFTLAMESRARLRALRDRLLDRNNLRTADIRRHVGQNLSLSAFRFHEEALGAALDTACRDNLRRFGHLGANDPLFNLYTALAREGPGDPGPSVVLNISPAASWSVLLVDNGVSSQSRSLAL
ncbi:3-oxoacyl-ACP synthase [Streptomyces seoulensis]